VFVKPLCFCVGHFGGGTELKVFARKGRDAQL
jgi:hypothetical protein